MIGYIKGEYIQSADHTVIIDNHGIGYELSMPVSDIYRLPPVGKEIQVYTYLHVREDDVSLFGFLTRDALEVFKMLIGVSGIGPKGAIGILSALTVDALRMAILTNDTDAIVQAPGIGKKTAQKLIIELADKLRKHSDTVDAASFSAEPGSSAGSSDDAIEALSALGYAHGEAVRAVQSIKNRTSLDVEEILKLALKKL